jgi:hypothetical protein
VTLLTGAYVQAGVAAIPAFEEWLGKPIDRVRAFAGAPKWPALLSDTWAAPWAASPYARRMAITVPMLAKDGKSTIAKGAAGAYDTYYRAGAQRLVNAGITNPLLIVGHEANAKWSDWFFGNDPAAWCAYWDRIFDAMATVPGNEFLFCWCMSSGWTGYDPVAVWRPKADVVGINFYDAHYNNPDDTPEQRWAAIYASGGRHGGLEWWPQFAASVGRPLLVAETGLVNKGAAAGDGTSKGGGGDDPYYVQQMHDWAVAHNVAAVCYQNSRQDDGDHLIDNGQYPQAALAFRQMFGGALTPAAA